MARHGPSVQHDGDLPVKGTWLGLDVWMAPRMIVFWYPIWWWKSLKNVETWLGFDHPTHWDSSDFGCKVLSWSSYSTSVWGPDLGGRDQNGGDRQMQNGVNKKPFSRWKFRRNCSFSNQAWDFLSIFLRLAHSLLVSRDEQVHSRTLLGSVIPLISIFQPLNSTSTTYWPIPHIIPPKKNPLNWRRMFERIEASSGSSSMASPAGGSNRASLRVEVEKSWNTCDMWDELQIAAGLRLLGYIHIYIYHLYPFVGMGQYEPYRYFSVTNNIKTL